jgi:type IV secretory pathway TrbD component
MLDQHRVHRSLLQPPLLFGVERRLFFVVAGGAVPFLTFSDMSLRAVLATLIYCLVSWTIALRITALDSNLLDLWIQSLRYKDQYDPLPSPSVSGTRLYRRKG